MKKTKLKAFLLSVAGALSCTCVSAQEVKAPVLNLYNFNDNSCVMNLSDNGDWAVSFGASASDGSRSTNARLINTRTAEVTELGIEKDTPLPCKATDVTDNGTVVGAYQGNAATWTKADGWQALPVPAGWPEGAVNAVTPDGRYAAGLAYNYSDGFTETGVMWDLKTRTIIELPNTPSVGVADEKLQMVRYTGITPDGRYLTGVADYSYTWNTLYFIYDRQTATWFRIGFNADNTPWTENLQAVEGSFSPDGKWFAGTAYIIKNASTGDEHYVPCRYNMETKKFELLEDGDVLDFETVVVDNAGTVYASSPSGTPIRSLYIRAGKFWYPLDELLKQRYGIDFYGKSGYDNTGTCIGVSGDGKAIACFPDPHTSYVMTMSESFAEAAEKVNLLANYTTVPADGSAFTKLKEVKIEFARDVKVLGTTNDIQLKDENGASVGKVLSFETLATSAKTLRIGFRTLTLEAGKKYTLTIPAGTVALKADETRTNEAMTITYTGRAATPVKVTAVSPESNATLSMLDVATNPVLLTFDTNIAATDTASAELYREGDDAPIASLSVAVKGNQALIYPATTEYLYLNTKYRVVLGAGSVTDINGDNANERHEVNYEGVYERVVLADDTLMFKEDFNNGVTGMLLYEGDHNTPNDEMKSYTFVDADNCPWIPVRDEDSQDFAAASTSAYSPAGKSDDWMMTPQIYIPDAKCRLEFQAQGFRKSKQDRLKVIIYANEKVINYLSKEETGDIRANGEVVMNDVVLPGTSENALAGDWKTYSFKLDKYAKKNIYVAFVNENEDQSLVFVDNVKVIRDNGFLTALTSPTSVVALKSQQVTGRVIGNSDAMAFNDLNARLLDAGKNVVDEISVKGLNLKKGDKYDFAFSKELPLTVGEVNTFYLRVQLDETFDTIKYSVKDLAFQPVKRVVLEEMTGQDCGNCPRGHLALENLNEIYGDRVIPVAYHVYTGDNYESGMSGYVQSVLGLSGAPSAKVNRGATVGAPMYDDLSEGKRTWKYSSPAGNCWLDLVRAEFDTDAEADVSVMAAYDESNRKVIVPCSARFAMNMEKQNIGIFLIVTEDNLPGYQHNYSYNSDDGGLGEWTKGGKYGQQYVMPYTFYDVARAQIGTSYYGTTGYIPATITGGEVYSSTISFDLPAVNDMYNCKVVCMMIDANTGAVINAASSKITTLSGIGSATGTAEATETARYNAAGQMIKSPQKGLNIIRMSDGTSRKVIVR